MSWQAVTQACGTFTRTGRCSRLFQCHLHSSKALISHSMTARGIDINIAVRRGSAPTSVSTSEIPLYHRIDGDEYILSHLDRLTVVDLELRFEFWEAEFLGSPQALSLQVRGTPGNRAKVYATWDNRSIQSVITHYIEALLTRHGLQGFANTIRVEFIIEYDAGSIWTQ